MNIASRTLLDFSVLLLIALSAGAACAGFNATVRTDRKAGVSNQDWNNFVSNEPSLVTIFTVQPNSKSFPTNAIVWNWTDSDCAGGTIDSVLAELTLVVELYNADGSFPGLFSLDWQGGNCGGGSGVAIPSNFGALAMGDVFRFTWGYPESTGFTFDLYKQNLTTNGPGFDFARALRIRTGLTGPPVEDSAVVRDHFYAYWLVAVRTLDGARSTETTPFLVTLGPEVVAEISLLPAAAGRLSIQFTGTLQSSPDLKNWQAIMPQPASPFLVTPVPGARYFRAVSP